MEIKKSPKADLENKRSMFLLIGLVLALGFTYICFEWTNKEVTVVEGFTDEFSETVEEEIVQATQQPEIQQPVAPPPTPVAQQVLNIVDDDVKVETEVKVEESESTNEEIIIPDAVAQDDDEEAEEEIFTIVEKQASFPGGQAALMEYLKKNLVFPQVAIDNNIQGRVFVEFVVNKDGSIQDVKVARGVDPILDKEAIRVVSKMPKWAPAEQRGKSCRSRFTLPILFKFK